MSSAIAPLLPLVILIVFAFLFFKIIRLPLKLLFKLLIHVALGFAALFLLNFFGAFVGLSLEVNLVNAAISGILGFPGVILLLLFQYIL